MLTWTAGSELLSYVICCLYHLFDIIDCLVNNLPLTISSCLNEKDGHNMFIEHLSGDSPLHMWFHLIHMVLWGGDIVVSIFYRWGNWAAERQVICPRSHSWYEPELDLNSDLIPEADPMLPILKHLEQCYAAHGAQKRAC